MSTAVADFSAQLSKAGLAPLHRGPVRTLQLNVTRRCNLACHHCHVESGPKRSEALAEAGAARVLELLAANPQVEVLDLTGGAPELSQHFRALVSGARALGRRVIDRCNLTVLFEPGQEDTAELLAAQGVEIVASLPCYTRDNVDRQRGRGVFDGSLEGLHRRRGLELRRRTRLASTIPPKNAKHPSREDRRRGGGARNAQAPCAPAIAHRAPHAEA